MHLICLQENLKKALNATGRIIGKSLTLPILNNVLLSAAKNRLKVSSTNLESGINYWVSCQVKESGEITVPAKLLADFVNSLPNDKIELKEKESQLSLKCRDFKANVAGLDASDFPIIPQIDAKPLLVVKGNILKNALLQVMGAASLSDSRPALCGIYCEFSKDSINFAATDSFRLAEKKVGIGSKDGKQSVIFPHKTIQEVVRMIGDEDSDDGELKMILSENQVLFDLGYAQIVSRLIEDKYPDYDQIIPKNFKTQVLADRSELIENVKIAGLFCGKVNDIKLSMDAEKQVILIQAKNVDVGDHRSKIGAEVKGESVESVFNYRYLLDGLSNIYSDKVIMCFNDGVKPVVIKPVGDLSYTYVVCPIRE